MTEEFGWAVDMSADGELIVGARLDDTAAINSGAIYFLGPR